MRRAPTRSDCLGASPRRVLHADPLWLDLSRSLSMQQELHDMQAIQAMFANGEQGGYWRAEAADLYEDSAGTTAASLNGVVGLWKNAVTGQPDAVQATTANKPYLRRTPTTNLWWADANTATSALTATFGAALGSTCTVARVGPEGVAWLENQTISTTYNIAPAYGWNGEMLVINRALTAGEKAIVTRYLTRKQPQLGPELITNGDFSNGGANWTTLSGVPVYTNNTLTQSGTTGFAVQQAIAYRLGSVCRARVVITENYNNPTNGVYIRELNPNIQVADRRFAVTGVFDLTFVGPTAGGYIRLGKGTTNGTTTFDSVSVREFL